ncbi:hypothetical protein EV361DRAFT_934340 [Lentinula raphanica]|nr:hypothetical protein EV361DRAFT_934340 [Lentinula raphanica]
MLMTRSAHRLRVAVLVLGTISSRILAAPTLGLASSSSSSALTNVRRADSAGPSGTTTTKWDPCTKLRNYWTPNENDDIDNAASASSQTPPNIQVDSNIRLINAILDHESARYSHELEHAKHDWRVYEREQARLEEAQHQHQQAPHAQEQTPQPLRQVPPSKLGLGRRLAPAHRESMPRSHQGTHQRQLLITMGAGRLERFARVDSASESCEAKDTGLDRGAARSDEGDGWACYAGEYGERVWIGLDPSRYRSRSTYRSLFALG